MPTGPGTALDAARRIKLIDRFGPEVAGWCDDLPRLVNSVSELWRLRVRRVLPAGGTSALFECAAQDGTAVVLKLTPDRGIAAGEAAALAAWADSPHVVRLLDTDLDRGVLLLELLRPGVPLAEDPAGWTLTDIAPVLADLWSPRPHWEAAVVPPLRKRVAFRVNWVELEGRVGLVSVVGVPLVGPGDLLPRRPRRVLVAGTSGSGKTTLAAGIGAALRIPHVEIDALFHGPAWSPRPSFEADVHRFSAEPSWVTEWQYDSVRDHLADRADLLVWLDLPRALVLRQVIRRTLVRRLRRQRLWNGNLEPPLWSIIADREHIVRWAWRTHDRTAVRVAELRRRRPDLVVVRLRSRRDIARWSYGPLQRAGAEPTMP